MLEVLIVGGGPSGLSAALNLVRVRRRVRIIDGGQPRNLVSDGIQSNITNAGRSPSEFRRIALEELSAYGDLFSIRKGWVTDIQGEHDAFRVILEDGSSQECRRVVLGLGMVDDLPDIPGLQEKWGKSVHHCPWCWGWEGRGQRLGMLFDKPEVGTETPYLTRAFLRHRGLLESERQSTRRCAEILAERGIQLVEGPVRAFVGEGEKLAGVEVEGAGTIPLDHIYIGPPQHQPPLIEKLGLELNEAGYVKVNDMSETTIPGIYAAGDIIASKQQVHHAIHTGAMAGIHIGSDLIMGSAHI